MPTNDFIGFASAGSANIMSQADYAAAAEQTDGVQPGPASSALANKIWRQGANMAGAIGQMIADAGYNARDDGDIATLKTALLNGLSSRFSSEFETGTFTPTIYGGTTPGSFTYSAQDGTYIKFNKLCFLELYVSGSVSTVPTGVVYIGGLPFVASSSNQAISLNLAPQTSGVVNKPPVLVRISTNNFILWGVNTGSNSVSSVNFDSSLSVGTAISFRFSGIYRIV